MLAGAGPSAAGACCAAGDAAGDGEATGDAAGDGEVAGTWPGASRPAPGPRAPRRAAPRAATSPSWSIACLSSDCVYRSTRLVGRTPGVAGSQLPFTAR